MAEPADELSIDELREEVEARQRGVSSNPALISVSTEELVRVLRDKQRPVYGVDDRVDVFQLTDPASLADADSVVAIFSATSIVDNGDGTSTLRTANYGAQFNLCPSEPFRGQPVGPECSGFLVAPDIIATAGHCVDDQVVTERRFVFGFRMKDAATATTVVNNSEIYRGVAVIGRELSPNGPDWALVRIDRPVPNHRVVTIRREGRIADGQAVHVIGHPNGLPTKFAGGANVRDNSPVPYFVANLDSYTGNSGSPVFASDSHVVEGILVRGETDLVSVGTCKVSLVCPTSGCRGEDVNRTTVFAALVPPPGLTPVPAPDFPPPNIPPPQWPSALYWGVFVRVDTAGGFLPNLKDALVEMVRGTEPLSRWHFNPNHGKGWHSWAWEIRDIDYHPGGYRIRIRVPGIGALSTFTVIVDPETGQIPTDGRWNGTLNPRPPDKPNYRAVYLQVPADFVCRCAIALDAPGVQGVADARVTVGGTALTNPSPSLPAADRYYTGTVPPGPHPLQVDHPQYRLAQAVSVPADSSLFSQRVPLVPRS